MWSPAGETSPSKRVSIIKALKTEAQSAYIVFNIKTTISSVACMSMIVVCRKKTMTNQHLHKEETENIESRYKIQSHF